MIKWAGFGKSLKQLFSIGLISCFILLGNFSDSEWVVRDNGNYGYSTLDNSIDLNVVNKGQLMSQRFGATKPMLAFASSENNRVYFFWSYNKVPYVLLNYGGRQIQGFLKAYTICDEIYFTGGLAQMSNCTSQNITEDFDYAVGGLFQSMTINDLWAYNIYYWNCYGGNQVVGDVCFSSSEYGKSICFSFGAGSQGGYCACHWCNNFTGSLGFDYNLDFLSINYSYLNTPPGFISNSTGNDLVGSEDININNSITGDYLYTTCTNSDVENYLESYGFNKYLCYGGLDNYSNYQTGTLYNPVPGQGVSLSNMILFESENFSTNNDWFNYFNGLYTRCQNNEYYCNKWVDYPAVYKFWFDFYYDYGGNGLGINKLVEYCKLIDSQNDGAVYTGQMFSNYCNTIITERRNNLDIGGQNPQGTNINGVGIFSGNTKTYNDPVVFIQDFFNQLKSFLPTAYDDLAGFLPNYIIMFLLALILFRFLSH